MGVKDAHQLRAASFALLFLACPGDTVWFYLNNALDLRNVGIINWDLDQLGLDDCSLPRLDYE